MENNEKLRRKSPAKTIMFCLCALMFVSSFALFAVSLALSLVNITAGGHISFTAYEGIVAFVNGTVTGTKTENSLDGFSIDKDTSSSFTTPDAWRNMTLDFDENNEIKIVISIENAHYSKTMWVKVSDNLVNSITLASSRGISGNETNINACYFSAYPVFEIAPRKTMYVMLSFSPSNEYTAVSEDLEINVELSSSEIIMDVEEYNDLYSSNSLKPFDYTSGGTTIRINSYDFEDYFLYIPNKLKKNGVECTVDLPHINTDNSDPWGPWQAIYPNSTIIIGEGFTELPRYGLGSINYNSSFAYVFLPVSLTSISEYAIDTTSLVELHLGSTEGWLCDGTSVDSSDLQSGESAATYYKQNYTKNWTKS